MCPSVAWARHNNAPRKVESTTLPGGAFSRRAMCSVFILPVLQFPLIGEKGSREKPAFLLEEI